MRKTLPFWLVIVVTAVALVASALLFVDYVRPSPVFCAEAGCAKVKLTVFAHFMGIPTPVFGIAGFLAIGLAELIPGRKARIAQVVLAVFGGLVAAGLLIVQAAMQTVCPYCAVADGAALILLVLSISRAVRGWDPPGDKRQLGAGLVAIVAAAALPIVIGMSKKAIPVTVPAVIAEEMRNTPRGKITVVDFVDFECPFCRLTHTDFAPILAARKDKVRVARKHVPLRMHPHAADAARAACCGEKLGKEDEIAEELFKAPAAELTPEGCEAMAAKHGLDVAKFRACMKDPATDDRIRKDGEAFRAAGGHGLPTIFVEGVKLEGAQDAKTLESTVDFAIRAL